MLKIKLPNLAAKNPAASQVAPEIQGASRSGLRQARVAVFGDVSLLPGHRCGKSMDGLEPARAKEPDQRKKGRDDTEVGKLRRKHGVDAENQAAKSRRRNSGCQSSGS